MALLRAPVWSSANAVPHAEHCEAGDEEPEPDRAVEDEAALPRRPDDERIARTDVSRAAPAWRASPASSMPISTRPAPNTAAATHSDFWRDRLISWRNPARKMTRHAMISGSASVVRTRIGVRAALTELANATVSSSRAAGCAPTKWSGSATRNTTKPASPAAPARRATSRPLSEPWASFGSTLPTAMRCAPQVRMREPRPTTSRPRRTGRPCHRSRPDLRAKNNTGAHAALDASRVPHGPLRGLG